MPETDTKRPQGVGRLLIAVYAVFALAASARAIFQIATKFSEAPLAYLLSALAGSVYLLATIALSQDRKPWPKIARFSLILELVGVLSVGTLSLLVPEDFPHDTVWSAFGKGYGFVPLLLPLLGLWWLKKRGTAA